MGRIVVGVDGSKHALRALRWSIDTAARRGADLTVMYAYPLPQVGPGERLPSDHDVRRQAERVVDEAIKAAAPPPHLAVKPLVRPVRRSPAAALLEEAYDADLLVVGSRGIGGFMALRLGSVSAQCAAHAHCPLVIMPPVDDAA